MRKGFEVGGGASGWRKTGVKVNFLSSIYVRFSSYISSVSLCSFAFPPRTVCVTFQISSQVQYARVRKEVWQKAKKWAKVRRHLEEEAQRQLDALAVLGTAALPERDMRQVGAREFSCGSGFFSLIFYCFIVQFNTVGVFFFFVY